jgi:NAD(P)-dependent dehydrogenase (short-subunit alcohol dehydrogenase family)
MGRLQGRVAIVTGGASGIGEGITARLAGEGAKVFVADTDATRGETVASSVDGVFVHCDVTKEDDVAASVAAATERFGRLDCYVANAGFSFAQGPIVDFDEVAFDKTVALLLKGVAFGMKHAARAMRAGAGGSIISTSSVAGLAAGMGPHVYSACKAAVISLTRTVAFEEGSYGIRVNCLCPGAIRTSFPARSLGVYGDEDLVTRLDEAIDLSWAPDIVLERRGTAADVAGAAAWLASDDASYVTGQAIVVDGGLVLGKKLAKLPDRSDLDRG